MNSYPVTSLGHVTFIDDQAELHATRCPAGAKLLQYVYLQDSDETPSTISRKDKATSADATCKQPSKSRAIAISLGAKIPVTTAMTQTQSKVLQSSQRWSMLLQLQTGEMTIIRGETMNWLQLLDRQYVIVDIVRRKSFLSDGPQCALPSNLLGRTCCF